MKADTFPIIILLSVLIIVLTAWACDKYSYEKQLHNYINNKIIPIATCKEGYSIAYKTKDFWVCENSNIGEAYVGAYSNYINKWCNRLKQEVRE